VHLDSCKVLQTIKPLKLNIMCLHRLQHQVKSTLFTALEKSFVTKNCKMPFRHICANRNQMQFDAEAIQVAIQVKVVVALTTTTIRWMTNMHYSSSHFTNSDYLQPTSNSHASLWSLWCSRKQEIADCHVTLWVWAADTSALVPKWVQFSFMGITIFSIF